MLTIEHTQIYSWEAAVRGMRNPLASWDRSDSHWSTESDVPQYILGPNDLDLARRLAQAGTEHAKYLRYITVSFDLIAPDYFFKEFSTYRVGVVENSTSTMHRIAAREFTPEDFSYEHLESPALHVLHITMEELNKNRELFLQTRDKRYWWQMIQLLPMSYNYRRTVTLNYQVLANMYHQRKNHKLDEWHTFCHWIEALPYSELITG